MGPRQTGVRPTELFPTKPNLIALAIFAREPDSLTRGGTAPGSRRVDQPDETWEGQGEDALL